MLQRNAGLRPEAASTRTDENLTNHCVCCCLSENLYGVAAKPVSLVKPTPSTMLHLISSQKWIMKPFICIVCGGKQRCILVQFEEDAGSGDERRVQTRILEDPTGPQGSSSCTYYGWCRSSRREHTLSVWFMTCSAPHSPSTPRIIHPARGTHTRREGDRHGDCSL